MSLYQSKEKPIKIRNHPFPCPQVQLRGESSSGEHFRRAGAGRVPCLLLGGLRVPHSLIQGHLHVVAAVDNFSWSVAINFSVSHDCFNCLQACRCQGCWRSPPL